MTRSRRNPLIRRPAEQQRPFRLTKRDLEVIKAVYLHRALTSVQIEDLLFPPDTPDAVYGKHTKCQDRLTKLFDHRYLWRDEQPAKTNERKPFVYWIDEKGVELLPGLLDVEPEEIEWEARDNDVSYPFLDHLLQTNAVRVAIEIACQRQGVTIQTWLDDKTLRTQQNRDYVMITSPHPEEADKPKQRQKVAIIPDGYFSLAVPAKDKLLHHLLEVDLANQVGLTSKWGRRDWVRKILAYLAYHKTGLYQKRFQADNFRTLTVTTSPRRLQTLRRITEEVGGTTSFWFTCFELLNSQTVLTDPIWQVATKEGTYPLIW